MVNTRKSTQLTALEQSLKDSPNFLLFQYERVPHTTLESLRKELRAKNSKFKMIKNSLFQKALRRLSTSDKKLKEINKSINSLVGNTALMTFSEEWSDGLSAFFNFADKEKGLAFKVGYLDQQFFLKDDLEKIAKLPSKTQLMANLIGSMKSPISHLTYAMKFNIQKLVYVLSSKARTTS